MSLKVNIKKKYKDFSLSVDFSSDSKRIGILGASGSGKSMTLGAVAGLIKPDEGEIIFDGRVLFDSAGKTDIKTDRRKIGYLFQDYALFPHMTVEKNIRAAVDGARRITALEKKKPPSNESSFFQEKNTDAILKQFGLFEVKDHLPSELSGGQKQRTALVRMLVTNPELLLLDEPFSALDTYLREGMRIELCRILNEYNKTAVIVSHDRDEIYQMCDYLVLLDRGTMIARGKTEDLFRQPGTVAAARLTGCKNISAVERLGENKIKALDWGGIELITEQKVDEHIRFAAVRAHDFIPGDTGINSVPVINPTVSTLPFEWYVMLENGLWWKIPKAIDESDASDAIPAHLSIPPDKIILLTE